MHTETSFFIYIGSVFVMISTIKTAIESLKRLCFEEKTGRKAEGKTLFTDVQRHTIESEEENYNKFYGKTTMEERC